MEKITSFTVDHNKITPGIYISRIDGNITTYDLRTRKPNNGDYMDNITMHSVEHMFATFIRNSKIKDNVIYFGPMGCQTGFYLLIKNANNDEVIQIILDTLKKITDYNGVVFGSTKEECGNYKNLDLQAAKNECNRYLCELLKKEKITLEYEQ